MNNNLKVSAINFLYKNKDFWTVILPFIIFIFFWDVKYIGQDIKFEHFQLRYIIVIPFIRLLFSKKLKDIVKSLYLPFLVIAHLIIVKFVTTNSYTGRDYLSVMLLLVVYTATYNYRLIIIENFHQIIKYFVIIFVILFSLYFSLFFPHLVLNCYNGWFSQTNFLFLENSHFALMAAPIIIYYNLYFLNFKNLNFKSNFELWFYCLFLIYSFINFSTTFLFGLVLLNILVIFLYLFFYKNKNKNKIIFTSIFFIIISILIVFNKSQCKSRSLDIIQNTDQYGVVVDKKIKNYLTKFQTNISIFYNKKILGNNDYIQEEEKSTELVIKAKSGTIENCKRLAEKLDAPVCYGLSFPDSRFIRKIIKSNRTYNPNSSISIILIHLQIAGKSLFNDPMGVGFNNHNFAHKKYITEIFNVMRYKVGSYIFEMNKFDAASNFSKIISEFGVFGIFFLFYSLVCFFRHSKDKPINILVFSFLTLQLIRGVGYFNGGFIVFVILYFFLIKKS